MIADKSIAAFALFGELKPMALSFSAALEENVWGDGSEWVCRFERREKVRG